MHLLIIIFTNTRSIYNEGSVSDRWGFSRQKPDKTATWTDKLMQIYSDLVGAVGELTQ